jgi:hypothetical protein
MKTVDEAVVITFNGEIYIHGEPRSYLLPTTRGSSEASSDWGPSREAGIKPTQEFRCFGFVA